MKKFLALSALVLTVGCMSTAPTDTPTAVTPILDKRLVTESGTVFMINSDGTMGGEWRGEEGRPRLSCRSGARGAGAAHGGAGEDGIPKSAAG